MRQCLEMGPGKGFKGRSLTYKILSLYEQEETPELILSFTHKGEDQTERGGGQRQARKRGLTRQQPCGTASLQNWKKTSSCGVSHCPVDSIRAA